MDLAALKYSTSASSAQRALDAGEGVLRLAPTWVPRAFCVPGRRLRLHPDDYFALGGERGGIDERWLSSTMRADNGPLTPPDEGMSFVVSPGGEALPLDTVVEHLGAQLIGERLWSAHRGWPMYSKFFDNDGPLPLHFHQSDEQAALVGRRGKPEAYYFAPEMNNHLGTTPYSYLGLSPGTTQAEFRDRLASFGRAGDNRITELSVAYRLRRDTGWDIPTGVLHAPGSLCTYEPQGSSDVLAMCECWTSSRTLSEDLLWKDVPPEHRGDFDYLVGQIDWEANADPSFFEHRFMPPRPIRGEAEAEDGRQEWWIVYRSGAFSAKRLEVAPGASVVVGDAAAYGCIVIAGHGTLGTWTVESPTLIRFGQLTTDEYFVSEEAARAGIRITNASATQTLVLLKHFGPGNPDLPTGERASV